jgi:hypothetical protein
MLLCLVAVSIDTAAGEDCYSLKQARAIHPGKHLYRSDDCWGPERRKRRGRDRDEPRPRKEEPIKDAPSDKIYVIKPWQPLAHPLFLPWDDRVEPIIHPGAKP